MASYVFLIESTQQATNNNIVLTGLLAARTTINNLDEKSPIKITIIFFDEFLYFFQLDSNESFSVSSIYIYVDSNFTRR